MVNDEDERFGLVGPKKKKKKSQYLNYVITWFYEKGIG